MSAEINLVHKNTDITIYVQAEMGRAPLFYSTKPTGAPGILDEYEFRRKAEFWVPPYKAMRLRDLIIDGTDPREIVRILDLHYRSFDDVIAELQRSRPDESLSSSYERLPQGHYRRQASTSSVSRSQRSYHDSSDGGFIAPIVDVGGGDGGGDCSGGDGGGGGCD